LLTLVQFGLEVWYQNETIAPEKVISTLNACHFDPTGLDFGRSLDELVSPSAVPFVWMAVDRLGKFSFVLLIYVPLFIDL
jgi:hypothetical protein